MIIYILIFERCLKKHLSDFCFSKVSWAMDSWQNPLRPDLSQAGFGIPGDFPKIYPTPFIYNLYNLYVSLYFVSRRKFYLHLARTPFIEIVSFSDISNDLERMTSLSCAVSNITKMKLHIQNLLMLLQFSALFSESHLNNLFHIYIHLNWITRNLHCADRYE